MLKCIWHTNAAGKFDEKGEEEIVVCSKEREREREREVLKTT